MSNKQFYVIYFEEVDTLIVQTAPLHDTYAIPSELQNGVVSITHNTTPPGMKVVGFTIKNISQNVSFLGLVPHMVQSLGVDALELTSALINAEAHVKSLKAKNEVL